MNRYEDSNGDPKFTVIIRDSIIFLIIIITTMMAGCPVYNVWQQGQAGEAELNRAEQNRKIKVEEAQAIFDSSGLHAKSEIERAKGVAEANKIIGDSLKGNEAYLRYLWIHSLEGGKNDVIYVPTEANLPIFMENRQIKK